MKTQRIGSTLNQAGLATQNHPNEAQNLSEFELNNLRRPLTSGERKVLDVFDQTLAPEWEIYLQPHLNGLKPDFVLLNPYVGLAVFEVKDWNLDTLKCFTQKNDRDEWELWAQDKALKRFRIRNPITS